MISSIRKGAFLAVLAVCVAGIGYGQTGTLTGTVSFGVPCSSGVGVGITFDGTNLWYSCYASATDLYRANPSTGAVSASYAISGGLGAIAYDAANNAIYAGPGGGASGGKITKITLDAGKNVTGSSTLFALAVGCVLMDGVAYDGTNSTLYTSCDGSTTITRYNLLGTIVEGPFPWSGPGFPCYNSGVAIGGNLLYEGSDGCAHVWVVDKVTKAAQFDFSTAVSGDPNFRDEGLTCDPKTFFASLGKHVMWSVEAYEPRRAAAFEIPLNSCGSGGAPPPLDSGNSCPLSQGFWKTHSFGWPATSMGVGGRTYSSSTTPTLLGILQTAVKGDASLILADQLITANFNILNGANPSSISATLAAAESLLAAAAALPAGVKTSSAGGQQMTAAAAILEAFNTSSPAGCTSKIPPER